MPVILMRSFAHRLSAASIREDQNGVTRLVPGPLPVGHEARFQEVVADQS